MREQCQQAGAAPRVTQRQDETDQRGDTGTSLQSFPDLGLRPGREAETNKLLSAYLAHRTTGLQPAESLLRRGRFGVGFGRPLDSDFSIISFLPRGKNKVCGGGRNQVLEWEELASWKGVRSYAKRVNSLARITHSQGHCLP